MLRVTAGSLRGRRVPVPKSHIRPTSERARQAFFNIVGERIVGARFLDLFAGSGIFSLEAVSRGAAAAVAIDNDRWAIADLKRLAAQWDVPVETHTADAVTGIKRLRGQVFRVIYADPPYDWKDYDGLLAAIDAEAGLEPGAVIAIEHRRNQEPFTIATERLQATRVARYGEVWISLFETAT